MKSLGPRGKICWGEFVSIGLDIWKKSKKSKRSKKSKSSKNLLEVLDLFDLLDLLMFVRPSPADDAASSPQ